MEFDAVILAGGRSSRLGGAPKAGLRYDGATLLDLALQAARGAQAIAVVGPDPGTLPAGVLNCREDPPFAGPAAAIAAGLSALEQDYAARRAAGPAPLTLVLACDMPRVDTAVRSLAAAVDDAGQSGRDGVMALSADGRKQPLIGFYGTAALHRSAADAAHRGALKDASAFALLASLDVRAVRVPSGSTDDVDTWDDASALGVTGRIQGNDPGGRPGAPQLNSTLEANGEKPG
ncbi:molybdenum cofactor guanylyltransferase [Pseudarthrobacter albicanus]|uniref:molybdenum cofactor guanylyltransferase n=1 Tax=Pseudarthrobacter albicanus TaxID=2823873 RepID=UPI0027DAD656|nr:NTP transferase domain-containing protein [Pseudarthrobacter albicanus]